MSSFRRTFLRPVAVVAAGLVTATMLQTPVQAAPVDDGASWLTGQLNEDSVVYNDQYEFEDLGLTIDVAFALQEVGGHDSDVAAIRSAMSTRVDAYTTYEEDVFANSTAKMMAFAQRTGTGAGKQFGGVNLLKRLNGLVLMKGRLEGRLTDRSSFGDSANTFGQAFAAEALAKAGSGKADEVRGFLLQQQCGAGWFRLNFSERKAAAQGCRAKPDSPDTDATVFAVSALRGLPAKNKAVRAAIRDGLDWLERSQGADGGHGGGVATEAANANSTGLAAWLLGDTGRCDAATAAAQWVGDLQVTGDQTGTPLEGEEGAVAYDEAAMTAGEADGITVETRDQWRRTGAQAVPGLRYVAGC